MNYHQDHTRGLHITFNCGIKLPNTKNYNGRDRTLLQHILVRRTVVGEEGIKETRRDIISGAISGFLPTNGRR